MGKENIITTSLNEHFAFLLKDKYSFGRMKHTGPMGCWEIVVESNSSDLIFKLISDRNEIFLVMSNREEKFWASLDVVVFFISNETISFTDTDSKKLDAIDDQLSNIAYVLQNYIEKIKIIFGKDSKQYKDELLISMDNFRTIQFNKAKNNNCE